MRIVMFYHSLLSDWNHGNAHFLRGVVTELRSLGHEVRVYEPRDSWSLQNLIGEYGEEVLAGFRTVYPGLGSSRYQREKLDLGQVLDGADLVLVHEWNDPDLVRRLGEQRRRGGKYQLLFHDTHHRAVSDPGGMAAYDLSSFDGALVFGNVLRELYLARGWARQAWTWHEAADTRIFRPLPGDQVEGDLVWIGNWGDEERTAELEEFLLGPVRDLGLKARVHGVRYPEAARKALAEAGIEYAGWLPNYEVAAVFARYRLTIHVPRRPYATLLPGIPTIRVFEALACAIPLVCSPWEDAENLFTPGEDFRVVRNGGEMKKELRALLDEPERARHMARQGRKTILARHTCRHRVEELLRIYEDLEQRKEVRV